VTKVLTRTVERAIDDNDVALKWETEKVDTVLMKNTLGNPYYL
jgi:hypothetical protein